MYVVDVLTYFLDLSPAHRCNPRLRTLRPRTERNQPWVPTTRLTVQWSYTYTISTCKSFSPPE